MVPGVRGGTGREGGRAGYTLVEVLVATTILAALMGAAAAGYATFLRAWSHPEVFGLDGVERLQRRWLVKAAVEGLFDYYVDDRERGPEPKRYPFFEGQERSFRFVTLASAGRRFGPAAAQLRYEPDEKGGGAVVYEETSLDRTYLKFGDEALTPTSRLVVYEGVRACRIEYFGWVAVELPQREEDEILPVFRWVRAYTGKQYGHTPQTIHLTAETETGTYDVWFQTRSYNPDKAKRNDPSM